MMNTHLHQPRDIEAPWILCSDLGFIICPLYTGSIWPVQISKQQQVLSSPLPLSPLLSLFPSVCPSPSANWECLLKYSFLSSLPLHSLFQITQKIKQEYNYFRLYYFHDISKFIHIWFQDQGIVEAASTVQYPQGIQNSSKIEPRLIAHFTLHGDSVCLLLLLHVASSLASNCCLRVGFFLGILNSLLSFFPPLHSSFQP